MTSAGRAYSNGLTPIFDALCKPDPPVSGALHVRVKQVGVGPTFADGAADPRLVWFFEV